MGKYKSARDGNLQRNFGITEEEADKAGKTCRACGTPPGTRSLHIDHDHKIAGWKIATERICKGVWRAWPQGSEFMDLSQRHPRLVFEETGRTKPEARAKVKARLKRLSVRGVLCWHCNAGLRKYQDDPVRIHKIAEYLDEYYAFVNGDSETRNGFKE